MINIDKLTPENIDAQFCSDWLKSQISELFISVNLLQNKLAAAEHARNQFEMHWAEARAEAQGWKNGQAQVQATSDTLFDSCQKWSDECELLKAENATLRAQLEVMGNANRELVSKEQEARAEVERLKSQCAVRGSYACAMYAGAIERADKLSWDNDRLRAQLSQVKDMARARCGALENALTSARDALCSGKLSELCTKKEHRSECINATDVLRGEMVALPSEALDAISHKTVACDGTSDTSLVADEIRPNSEAPYSNKRAETVISGQQAWREGVPEIKRKECNKYA